MLINSLHLKSLRKIILISGLCQIPFMEENKDLSPAFKNILKILYLSPKKLGEVSRACADMCSLIPWALLCLRLTLCLE